MKFDITQTTEDPRKRKWRENNRDKHTATMHAARTSQRANRDFTGIDGEGQQRWCNVCDCKQYSPASDAELAKCAYCKHGKYEHEHVYVLLGCGDHDSLENMNGITWEEAFEYLYACFLADPDSIYAGFFLAYDYTQIFKTMPVNKAASILTTKGEHKRRRLITGRVTLMDEHVIGTLNGNRVAWDVNMQNGGQLWLRPMTCGCSDPRYHRKHCKTTGCEFDHHLAGKLCHWRDGKCKCDDPNWHAEYCRKTVDGKHPEDFHHVTPQCRMKRDATVKPPDYMVINDAGSLFQSSFLTVINPEDWYLKTCAECRATPCLKHGATECIAEKTCDPVACAEHSVVSIEEYRDIEIGKQRRYHAVLDNEMRRYNKLENNIFSRVMANYRDGLLQAGITLGKNQWFGPGQIAGNWLKQTGQAHQTDTGNPLMRATLDRCVPPYVMDIARASYYGGWFEVFAHGHIPGITWEYDINSAYPDIISRLPCLVHGKWQTSTAKRDTFPRMPKDAPFRLVHATVRGSDKHIGPVPYRSSLDAIFRPHSAHGWYWQDELEASQRAGLIDTFEIGPCSHERCVRLDKEEVIHYFATLTYIRECDCPPPCASMADMYRERLRAGKKTPKGKALKLAMNSPYGKFAQTVGDPPFNNFIYASRITSGCRTKILDAIAIHPDKSAAVMMIATDGVYFRTRMPETWLTENVSGDELGKWEEDQKINLTIFKPGVYWDDKARADIARGETPKFKARGISARNFARAIADIDEKFSAWNGQYPINDADWPRQEILITFSMITARMALNQNKWSRAGRVSTARLTQDSNPYRKRDQGYFDGSVYRSVPRQRTIEDIASKPYDKTISTAYQDENENDGSGIGISPDGDTIELSQHAIVGG